MSNIYNRRLDYDVLSSGKRILERPEKVQVPKYAVVGNTAPNLDFQVNRMLQPLFATKQPIPQSPYVPKAPVNAHGLGGRTPYYIDYLVQPMASFKTRPPKGLLWEPNSIRETRQNVYPDGVPKNLSQLQQADSQYLENLNNDKKQKQLEQKYQERSRVGGHDGSRPHPDRNIEAELKRLDEMLAETKYGKGAYKNIALSAEGHAKMAQQQAEEIRAELNRIRAESRSHKADVVSAIEGQTTGVEDFTLGDPSEEKDPGRQKLVDDANKYIQKLEDDAKSSGGNKFTFTKPIERVELMKQLLISNGLDEEEADYIAIKSLNEGKITRITSLQSWYNIARVLTLPSKVETMKKEYKKYESDLAAGKIKKIAIEGSGGPISGKKGGARKGSV